MTTFKKRRVGKTSLEVTELSLGTASMAGLFVDVPDDAARATVRAAVEADINLVDTAPHYGIGRGVNEWEVMMSALDLGDWDVFLLAGRYTLLEQTSLDPLLTTCL